MRGMAFGRLRRPVLALAAAAGLVSLSLGGAAASSIVFSGNGIAVDTAPYQHTYSTTPDAPTYTVNVVKSGTDGTISLSWTGASSGSTSSCSDGGTYACSLTFYPSSVGGGTTITITGTPGQTGTTAAINGPCTVSATDATASCSFSSGSARASTTATVTFNP